MKPRNQGISSAFIPDIDKNTVIREVTSTRPVIRLVEKDGIRAIVKDFSHNGFMFRNIVGRFLIWREARAYRQLSGLQGIPRLLAVIKGMALVTEAVPGMDMKAAAKTKQLTPGFFDHLNVLVDRVHELGIAHCDLKASGNIIVSPAGRPYIIDWAASISQKEFGLFPLNKIYNRFVVDDYRAITKFKLRYLPECVGAEEKTVYNRRSRGERWIRTVRDKLRSFLQQIV